VAASALELHTPGTLGTNGASTDVPNVACRNRRRVKDILLFSNIRLCLKTRSGFERLFFRLTASGYIDDTTNIACFAVFVRQKNARSRADDGVFRKSLCLGHNQEMIGFRL